MLITGPTKSYLRDVSRTPIPFRPKKLHMDWIKKEIWPAVQPVLRETQVPEYPYSVGGTIFLAVYRGRAFAITARHVLFPLTPICLFANDWSQRILPLENVFSVPRENEDDDWADFTIIEMDMRKLMKDQEYSLLKLIDLEKVSGDWRGSSKVTEFFVFGYPLEHTEIQISEKSITTARFMLRGNYRGVSEHSSGVHTIVISHTNGVTEFNGFSGGPVFAFLPNARTANKVFLCGMAIRGSFNSGLIHFLELEVLIAGIQVKPAPYKVELRKKA